jgi:hypothetical protein
VLEGKLGWEEVSAFKGRKAGLAKRSCRRLTEYSGHFNQGLPNAAVND